MTAAPVAPSERPASQRAAAAKTPATFVHAEDIEAFLGSLAAPIDAGLDAADVAARAEKYGPNRLPEAKKKSNLLRILGQFANPLVLTLLAAAVIAVFVGATSGDASFLERFGDAIAILLIVILNAFLGFYQERRAEAALDALQKLSAPNARVRRGGKVAVVPAAELVPGDVIELEAGDAIAADARLVETIDLATEEAALTGESAASVKDANAPVAKDAPLADRATMVFTGTTVVRGKGRAVVTSTGARSELGRIGEMIASVGDQKTPLEDRLDKFGSRILWACLLLSAVLLGVGAVRGDRKWPILLLEAVSLAVAAIPEGLPAITTITLALGMQRMAKRGAIVRKLAAVETLGSATIIASDKTGTLTQNEMTVRSLWAGGKLYKVTGEGYEPTGQILDESGAEVGELTASLHYTLATAALCNNAELDVDPETKRWRIVGDPTEAALLTLAAKRKLRPRRNDPESHRVGELPFDSDRKRMAVITRDAKGREVVHVKGSVDVLLARCVKLSDDGGVIGLTDEHRTEILAHAERMSERALRVLAICRRVKKGGSLDGTLTETPTEGADQVERELTFLGLVGMMDPPRAGVREAVAVCKRAGVRAVMITGDHRITATAVAREIGLWDDGDEAITGAELAELDDAGLT
ncbi:MAG TPA: HAD-IC family P-type ATPase, partial [Byssovorax sp.]